MLKSEMWPVLNWHINPFKSWFRIWVRGEYGVLAPSMLRHTVEIANHGHCVLNGVLSGHFLEIKMLQ